EAEAVLRQADVKTEVFLAGDLSVPPRIEEHPAAPVHEAAGVPTFTFDAPLTGNPETPPPHTEQYADIETPAEPAVVPLGGEPPADPEFFTSPNRGSVAAETPV